MEIPKHQLEAFAWGYEVVVTANSEYHIRGMRCIGIRSRVDGSWQDGHKLVGASVNGCMLSKDKRVDLPFAGGWLLFKVGDASYNSSQIDMIRRPSDHEVKYLCQEAQDAKKAKQARRATREQPIAVPRRAEMPPPAPEAVPEFDEFSGVPTPVGPREVPPKRPSTPAPPHAAEYDLPDDLFPDDHAPPPPPGDAYGGDESFDLPSLPPEFQKQIHSEDDELARVLAGDDDDSPDGLDEAFMSVLDDLNSQMEISDPGTETVMHPTPPPPPDSSANLSRLRQRILGKNKE